MSVAYAVRSMGTHTPSRALIKSATGGRSFLAYCTHSSAPDSSRSRTRAFFTHLSSPFRRPHPNNQDASQQVAATRDHKVCSPPAPRFWCSTVSPPAFIFRPTTQ
ncbi:hypothetical protein M405DRAFT_829148 [Rhizopogon salebrosus TDB-379]|nr:hypothetical protein M405DRAFT_829148 [Rhizopogon salebrosus TDB-379]